ncbi:hypothetical protein D9611_002706 [Ephemerocybe angulata]|uniref:Vacuolar membrane protein n=1 Tax=Ephemerocybe angulata TaxID=980116 RepID=A0A8H5C1M8_9AGAR|nr:hypothetical protein D9611_002706 [Tulosesus angulatus]
MSVSSLAGAIPANATGLFGDNPDVDPPSCQLLGPTALVVQALMGVLVILSLVYKRHREKPMRPWRIWMFDVSKQVIGQMFVHGLNVLISGVISDVTEGNACVSYFLNILIDTTLGVAIIYGVLHLLTFVLSDKMGLKGFESGVYGKPPSLKYWLRQAAIYAVALTTMKFFVIALLVFFPGIFKIGDWLLSWTWTGEGDALQVIFVMGIFPIAMNILQFWLIDSIVKASSGVALDPDTEDHTNPDREPLFNGSSDDEDDDHHHRPRNADIENQISHRPSHSSMETHSRAKSYTTGITTPDDDEHKSLDKTTQDAAHDHHSYPPSLSNSFTSASSSTHHSLPRTKHLANPTSRSNSSSWGPNTPEPSVHTNPTVATSTKDIPLADEWAVTWDEEDDDGWGAEAVPAASKINDHEFDRPISQTRPRRLS